MSDNNRSVTVHVGTSFWGLLTIVLVVLKLCGLAQISWFTIACVFFAPVLIIGLIVIAIVVVGALVGVLGEIFKK